MLNNIIGCHSHLDRTGRDGMGWDGDSVDLFHRETDRQTQLNRVGIRTECCED